MAARRRTTPVSKADPNSSLVVGVVRSSEESEPLTLFERDSSELSQTIRVEEEVLADSLIEYQALAMRTRGKFDDQKDLLTFSALEVASESGEMANIVYKHVFQGHNLDREHLLEEIGDVLWGLASMADALGVTLHTVGAMNIDKLARRYHRGRFTTEDSIARLDHDT